MKFVNATEVHRKSRGVGHPVGCGRERIKEATLSKQAAGKAGLVFKLFRYGLKPVPF
jgi:hypothetical protein